MSEHIKTVYRGWSWSEMGVCLDKGSQYFGWLFGKHPDGQWVTLADLKAVMGASDEPQSTITALRERVEELQEKLDQVICLAIRLPEKECTCTISQRLVGGGCEVCNTRRVIDLILDPIPKEPDIKLPGHDEVINR